MTNEEKPKTGRTYSVTLEYEGNNETQLTIVDYWSNHSHESCRPFSQQDISRWSNYKMTEEERRRWAQEMMTELADKGIVYEHSSVPEGLGKFGMDRFSCCAFFREIVQSHRKDGSALCTLLLDYKSRTNLSKFIRITDHSIRRMKNHRSGMVGAMW
jgi:hypothetical protein